MTDKVFEEYVERVLSETSLEEFLEDRGLTVAEAIESLWEAGVIIIDEDELDPEEEEEFD